MLKRIRNFFKRKLRTADSLERLNLCELPAEIIQMIFHRLESLKTIGRLQKTSKVMNQSVKELFWKSIDTIIIERAKVKISLKNQMKFFIGKLSDAAISSILDMAHNLTCVHLTNGTGVQSEKKHFQGKPWKTNIFILRSLIDHSDIIALRSLTIDSSWREQFEYTATAEAMNMLMTFLDKQLPSLKSLSLGTDGCLTVADTTELIDGGFCKPSVNSLLFWALDRKTAQSPITKVALRYSKLCKYDYNITDTDREKKKVLDSDNISVVLRNNYLESLLIENLTDYFMFKTFLEITPSMVKELIFAQQEDTMDSYYHEIYWFLRHGPSFCPTVMEISSVFPQLTHLQWIENANLLRKKLELTSCYGLIGKLELDSCFEDFALVPNFLFEQYQTASFSVSLTIRSFDEMIPEDLRKLRKICEEHNDQKLITDEQISDNEFKIIITRSHIKVVYHIRTCL